MTCIGAVVAMLLSAWCPGRPKTKGSLTCRPNGSVRENVVGSKEWRQLMAQSFRIAYSGAAPCDDPVSVGLVFYLPVTNVIAVRAGDIDKLVRNVLDALTDAKIYTDDVNVARVTAEKLPADQSARGAGVYVQVHDLAQEYAGHGVRR